ncbi:MAG: glycosyltransferase [Thermodesulfobacteriota bacterium]|nr:glycosyltransferase [Thermodesulfobacteriota bacterium]
MHTLEDYRTIVGDDVVRDIHRNARYFYDKRIVHVNSTYQGGGVAEILNSLLPLMHDIGIDAGWRILHGNPDFFTITKKFHNALQGQHIHFTKRKKELHMETNETFSKYMHVRHDCVIVHDPQPLPLIKFYQKRQPWIWRCHVDLSHPDKDVWDYISNFLLRYDLVILSHESYKKKDLPVEQWIVHPAIDPLSLKNMEISEKDMSHCLNKAGVPRDKPIITQISRFDKWKDPEGVIKIFTHVKEKVDCRLVLCGNMATDDPEGQEVYDNVVQAVKDLDEKGDIILITDPMSSNFIFINTLQRISDVVIQKSTREGFGLTVTEALWKGTPVVASNVGGIPLQITDGENGFLLDPDDTKGFANAIVEILKDRDLANDMGKKGKEHVRKKFLITRLLLDYMDLLKYILENQ